MQDHRLVVKADGVSSVCPALIARDDVILRGKVIYEFAFAFVAELRTDENRRGSLVNVRH